MRSRQSIHIQDPELQIISTDCDSFPVDCQWHAWGAWSSCADSCDAADGSGDRERTRTSTQGLNGGTTCNRPDGVDTQSCDVECPGKENNRCCT